MKYSLLCCVYIQEPQVLIVKQNTSDILWAPGFAQRNLGYLPQRASRLMSNTKLKIKHNDQSEKRQHNKQPMRTQAHCPKRGKTRVTESVREVTHVVYFSLSLAPTDAFPPFFPMRKTDYFSFSALKNSTTRPALTPLCLRCIILCLECMFYSRFYFKSWALSFSFLLFSFEILVSFIRLSWKKVLYSCYPL